MKEKIAKIHKKFATSVPFPVSVSSNKYASLVVEDVDTQCTMDCADTTASFVSPSVSSSATVSSMGVPKSGPAPDVKRGVLNSCVLINGQKFPSLASSDSESPTDDLEVGFPVELRQTIVSQSEGLGRTNNHNQHNKGLRKGKWWCASMVPEGGLLMGKGMLLHQRSDADADRGHS